MMKKSSKKSNESKVWFIVIVIVICVVLIGSIYYSKHKVESQVNANNYHEFQFYYDQSSELWFTKIELNKVPYTIPYYFHPNELEDINVEEDVENIILVYRPKKIIISLPGDSSSDMAIAGIEIAKITGERYEVLNIKTVSAVNDLVEGLPYATCDNASQEVVVISFKKSNRNTVYGYNRCIILEYKEGDAVRVADAFSYSLIKVM
ncbi:hypothetical protein H8D36_04950 [archaeon]|nr:hypothetical protein [archaeon]MBL7056744.1 hypothetical protein [Candidatus Woesearchaeota archaeon]